MDKPYLYIHTNDDIIEIFDGSYTPHFDEGFRICLIDFNFTDKNVKGDLSKLKSSDIVSIESDQFVVNEGVISEFSKLDEDLEHIPIKESFSHFSLNVELKNPFVTGSDLDEHRKFLKRKRTICKIIKL